MSAFWGRTSKVISWALMLTVTAAGVALIIVPKAVGGRPLTVLSGSMVPEFSPGDVVVVKPVDTDNLRVGDVITFQEKSDIPDLVSHRIISVTFTNDGKQFVTQGDANGAPDLSPVKPAQVKGEVWYSVPKVGYVATSMAGGWLRTIADVVAVLLLLYSGWAVTTGLVARARRKDADPEAEPEAEAREEVRA